MTACRSMESTVCVAAVLSALVVVVGVGGHSEHQGRLMEALVRSAAEHALPSLLPAVKSSRVSGVRALADGILAIEKYTSTVDSPYVHGESVMSNLTIYGLSPLKLSSKGNSLLMGINDTTISGQYSIHGTMSNASIEGQGWISIHIANLETEVSVDSAVIGENKIAVSSIDYKIFAPSFKMSFQDLVVDTGAVQFLKDLLGH